MKQLEIKLLLQAIKEAYGYDFSEYRIASLQRRLELYLASSGKEHLSELIYMILQDSAQFHSLLNTLTISITEMFRDPPLFKFIRDELIQKLATFPVINVWSAGCSTGLEAYSLAILFEEAGLYRRTQIYGTDINPRLLKEASAGIYPEDEFAAYSENYNKSGGSHSLSEYFHMNYRKGLINEKLKSHVSFFSHNLVTDSNFIEAQMIICSNVLIYFNQDLQRKVLNLFYNSLHNFGYLVLGMKERVPDAMLGKMFEKISPHLPVYQKVPHG